MSLRPVLRGFATLLSGALLTQVVGFVAVAYAARHLGPSRLGAATFALSLALYFSIPANFGLAVLGVRDIAREPERRREILGEVLGVRLVLGLVTTIAMAALAPALAADHDTRRLIPLAALSVIGGSLSGEWVLLGLQRSGAVGFARMAGQGVYGVLVLVALGTGFGGSRDFVLYTTLSIAITGALTLVLAWRAVGAPAPPASLRALRTRTVASAPLGLALVMFQVYQSIGLVLLGYHKSSATVGQFGVAQKVPLALYGLMDLWGATLFPQAARLIDDDRDELRRQVRVFTSLGVAVAVPLVVGGAIVAGDLVPLLFGDAYGPAVTPFVLLLGGLAIALVTITPAAVLASSGQERGYALAVTAGAVVTLVAGLVLIPAAGADGAAIAVLLAEVVVLALVARRFAREIGGLGFEGRRLAAIAAATVVMAGAMLLAQQAAGVLVVIGVGVVAYLGAAAAGGVARLDEVRP